MTILRARDYQQESIDAVNAAWRRGVMRPAVVLPTGAGKTVTFSHLIHRYREHNESRVVVLIHFVKVLNEDGSSV